MAHRHRRPYAYATHMKVHRVRFLLPELDRFSYTNSRDLPITSPSPPSTVSVMDNDGIHKLAYQLRELFADLLRLVAPELAADLDFERAKELATNYVEPGRDGLAQRVGDMAWNVPRLGIGATAQLVVVIEFQSTVNQRMATRMREYRRLARERLATSIGGPLAVLPIVLYNGSDRWTASGAATGLPEWSAAARLTLAPFQEWDYVLLCLEQLRTEGGLAHLPLANRAAATLRLQVEPTLSGLLARFREEWQRFPDAATRRVLHVWTEALLENLGGARSTLPTLQTLSELDGARGETEMATVSEALLGKWFEEVRAEYVAEGIEQGIERGVAQERSRSLARLRRQATIKFGAQTAGRLSALLEATLSAERMEHIGDRVSEWIVECQQGEELLARASALVGNGGTGR